MPEESSLSLAETNKVRLSLGLAPLADDSAGEVAELSDDPDALAEANYSARRQEEASARLEKETKERLAKAKNQRDLRAKLKGKGLGENDDEKASSTSGADWVKQSRKRAKERAVELEKLKQREKELEDRDREAIYGEEDLAGLRVAHGAEDIEEGRDFILTLADKKVLDDDDDELQNVNLAEYARTKERMDLKKKGKTAYTYTGYDDEEFDAAASGSTRGVLSKYDETIGAGSGPKDGDGFRLGSALPSTSRNANGNGQAAPKEPQRELNRDLLSLDYSKAEQNDYLQEGEVGFKIKKKKKKSGKSSSSRRAVAEADEGGVGEAPTNGGDVEMDGAANDDEQRPQVPAVPTAERRLAKEGATDSVVDDEDLQAALARQRRLASKKRIQQLRGEDVARQLMEQERAGSMPVDSPHPEGNGDGTPVPKIEEQEEEQEVDDRDGGGLVMDDTSEFIRNISARPIVAKREQAETATSKLRVKPEPTDDDVALDELVSAQEPDEPEEGEAYEGAGMEYDEDAMRLDRAASTLSEDVKPDVARKVEEKESDAFGSTADEKLVSGGLASTLSLLRQSGQIKALTPEEQIREKANKERERFIAEARMRDAQREMDRLRSKAQGANKDQAQREYENKQRQFEHAQQTLEAFKNYKPNVEIVYHDEFGRNLTPKEAWKDLSHKFHGKGSGTNKREKLLRKVAEEKKREAMASGDSPLSVGAAFQARQERMGSATMVIGVGNKNAAPSADQLLGPSSARSGVPIAKNKAGQASGSGQGANKRRKTEPKVLG